MLMTTTIVCETNQACSALLDGGAGGDDELTLLKGSDDDAVCYAEGYGIKEMFQMCDVTSTSVARFVQNEC